MGSLPEDLVRPDRTLVETHISWVLLGPEEVWKLKKPVDFGFLDFTSPEARLAACRAELELNRRLASDVYLDLVPVTRGPDGRLRLGGSGPALDHAVHMRRLPDEARGDVRLGAGTLGFGELERIAERLVDFHGAARPSSDPPEVALETIVRNVQENFGQTRESIAAHLDPGQARELEAWQLDFLERHRELLLSRASCGRVRDGHGDLRLEHVYLEEGRPVTIIDCIEFNERFRIADVCCDLAFLTMDLAYQGRVDLAESLLASYAQLAGDYDLYRLINFYESYRAHVRAKVSLLLADDAGAPLDVRQAARDKARRYFLLALAEERKPLAPPHVVAVGGVIASGKSTIAREIGRRLGAPLVGSDRTRKQLAGARPDQSLGTEHFTGDYSPARTAQVYEELLRRAEAVLASGRSVVLDASFREVSQRAAARQLAARHGVPFYFVECRAPEDHLRTRLEERSQRPGEVSDARSDLLDSFLARWEPASELPPTEHLALDTGTPLESSLRQLSAHLPFWPTGH